MNTVSRITTVQLSHEQLDKQTVQTKYKAGYGLYNVKSKFAGDKMLSDLLFEIILKKHNENFLRGRHDL